MDLNPMKQSIWNAMNTLKNSSSKIFDHVIKDEDITRNQAVILLAIANADEVSIQQLAFLLELNQGNTSTACKKLEQLGYLRRVRSTEDERIVNLVLEPKGEQLTINLKQKFDALETHIETFDSQKMEEILHAINNANELLEYVLRKINEEE